MNLTASHDTIIHDPMETVGKMHGMAFACVVKKTEVFQKYGRFLLRMAKICVTEKLTAFLLAKAAKRVYNISCI